MSKRLADKISREVTIAHNAILSVDVEELRTSLATMTKTVDPDGDGLTMLTVCRNKLTVINTLSSTFLEMMAGTRRANMAARAEKEFDPDKAFEKLPDKERSQVRAAVAALKAYDLLLESDDFGDKFDAALLRAADDYKKIRRQIKKPSLVDLVYGLARRNDEASTV